jgi:hypothetical protein
MLEKQYSARDALDAKKGQRRSLLGR